MKTIIEQLYESFYIEPKIDIENKRIERNEQQLKIDFSEEQKKLLLKIIDDYDLITERISFESFTQGFRLGCKLTNEIYEKDGLSSETNDFADEPSCFMEGE